MNSQRHDPLVDFVERYVLNPWPALAGGYAAVLTADILALSSLPALAISRQVLVFLGLLFAGWAVWMRLRLPWDDGQERMHGCVAVFAAAGVPLLALYAMDEAWDSGTLILKVLAGVAVGGGVLVLLPQFFRRLVLSLLVLYHFLGITLAATTLPVAGKPPPWLNLQASTRLYVNYLHFMYLTNAYHFYSPDPGAAQLLWFHITYTNNKSQWVYIPKREDFRTRLEFQRRLGVTESTNDVNSSSVMPPQVQNYELEYRLHQCNDPDHPERRALLLNEYEIIRLAPFVQKPSAYSQMMLSSYVRFIARNYPYPDDPDVKVASIKVYRVTHTMLSPQQFVAGEEPIDPTTYLPFYQGEYDADGKLMENDGFMYTPLPIEWKPARERARWIPDKNWETESRESYDADALERRKDILVDRMKMHAEYMKPRTTSR
jgi:hypothetical protein